MNFYESLMPHRQCVRDLKWAESLFFKVKKLLFTESLNRRKHKTFLKRKQSEAFRAYYDADDYPLLIRFFL